MSKKSPRRSDRVVVKVRKGTEESTILILRMETKKGGRFYCPERCMLGYNGLLSHRAPACFLLFNSRLTRVTGHLPLRYSLNCRLQHLPPQERQTASRRRSSRPWVLTLLQTTQALLHRQPQSGLRKYHSAVVLQADIAMELA